MDRTFSAKEKGSELNLSGKYSKSHDYWWEQSPSFLSCIGDARPVLCASSKLPPWDSHTENRHEFCHPIWQRWKLRLRATECVQGLTAREGGKTRIWTRFCVSLGPMLILPSQSVFPVRQDLDKQESVSGKGDHYAAQHGSPNIILWTNERIDSSQDYWLFPTAFLTFLL